MILVTGGTGNVGRAVVRRLLASGQPVRVLTRDPKRLAALPGVEVAVGDLTQAPQTRAALQDVSSVFLVHVPGANRFAELAHTLNVKRVVFLSSGAIDAPTENAIGRNHRRAELAIEGSGLHWTFLRPGAFMTNALQWVESIQRDGVVRAPFGDVGTPLIDPGDIGAVAAEILVTSGHDGKIYSLTGPEVLSVAEQVHILAGVLGQPIRLETVPDAVARTEMQQWAPLEIVDAIFSLMRDTARHPQKTSDTVARITGAPAHTFRQWVEAHVKLFRP